MTTLAVDFYISMRSPYSYLVTPRLGSVHVQPIAASVSIGVIWALNHPPPSLRGISRAGQK